MYLNEERQTRLKGWIQSHIDKLGSLSSAYHDFERHAKAVSEEPSSYESFRRWYKGMVKVLSVEAVIELAAWRKEAVYETELWLLGSPEMKAQGLTLSTISKFIAAEPDFAIVWELASAALERMGELQQIFEPERPEKQEEKKILIEPRIEWFRVLGRMEKVNESLSDEAFLKKYHFPKEAFIAFKSGQSLELTEKDLLAFASIAATEKEPVEAIMTLITGSGSPIA